MDLIGIENEAEFFPSGTLSDVLKDELHDITSRWANLGKDAHPVERLARIATPTIEALRQIRNTSDRERQAEVAHDAHYALLNALGYAWKRETALTALNGNPVIPLVGRAADTSGRDVLWILEAPITSVDDESADPLGALFIEEQFPEELRDVALLDRTIESALADGIFDLTDGPRHILIFGLSQIVLVDKRKWPARSVLRFDLQEIFSRAERDTLTVMACLISREARVPDQGSPISDRLEEEAQRNANAVTTSLKRTVRDAIELLGQEVLDVTGGKYPSTFPDQSRRGVWIDGPELSRECLRYMYRLLFLFYAEANPRLNLLDLRNPIYASGYSLEGLRDLESVPLRTTADREGTLLWESLQRTLDLLYTGLDLLDEEKGSGLRLPTVKVSLLDPESTPLLNGLRLRNEAIQKVIRLLSLRSTGKSTGRISYAKLGIGQLGAVYETLISFTGVVAKTDLIELKPRKGRSSDNDEEERESEETDEVAEDDLDQASESEDEDDAFRRDKVDPLAPSWFVPRSRVNEFAPEEIVFKGSEALIYPKGTFIYRLAGRDREKSASYYTPEPLARLLVKHALMERCRGLNADELLELKILEPAMGSAAFLVETANQLADLYLERKQKEVGRTIPQEDIVLEKQRVRAFIADRNCFGVDLNPIAVELGAISLWLNSLHSSEFSPWFGDQLHAGNSLIGARRAAYGPSLLSARAQGDLWFNGKPDEIGWRNPLPEGHVWQWLLPAKDMANFDKDKSIAPFAKSAQDQIKGWRRSGFFTKLEPHEIKLVQKLSEIAEELFNQVVEDLAKTRAAADDEITLWPQKVMPGNKRLDFHEKARLNARLIGADHATNTLPYKRLKTAMDAWCALWLWPLDKTDALPSRREFFEGMRLLLDGGFSADGSVAPETTSDIQDPAPDFFDKLEPSEPAGDLFKSAAKRQDRLFRETNVEALIENFDWLKIAAEVAERERFVHFDLIFADLMKARGGFDVIVGNPPWAKVAWSDIDVLADIDPALAIKNMTAKQAADEKEKVLSSTSHRRNYFAQLVALKGQLSFYADEANCPYTGGGAKNLYRLFFDLSLRMISSRGTVAVIHQDGHLSSASSNAMRPAWYKRIIKHFEFSNQLRDRNFLEVLNTKRFSLNIYRGFDSPVEFLQFTNAFLASQIDDSFSHDGKGICTGIKDNGSWVTRGHGKRIFSVTENYLRATGRLADTADEEALHTPFFQVLNADQLVVLETMGRTVGLRASGVDLQFSSFANQGEAERDGSLLRQTSWSQAGEPFFISGPIIYPLNPLAKTPRRICSTPKHYDVIDLSLINPRYRPRSIFSLPADVYERRGFEVRTNWSAQRRISDYYRFVFRRRIDVGTERSLSGAIFPPNALHAHQLTSVAFKSERDLLNAAALWSSLVYDFAIKSMRQSDVLPSTISNMPWVDLPDHALLRVIQLNCLTEEYSMLWNSNRRALSSLPSPWSGQVDIQSEHESKDWSEQCAFRSPLLRRLALIEIDVLVGISLGLNVESFLNILTAFPILMQNESSTYYDKDGKIVWTAANGLEQSGYLEDGRRPTKEKWDAIYSDAPARLSCTAIDDTIPGGPHTITRHFIGPFTQRDRIEDYRHAWAHFEQLKTESEG